ncbi:MAG: response regulator [Deltaproteobacteria bacterium]|nr:response regulator [Deltaproteobacteria bacterium]
MVTDIRLSRESGLVLAGRVKERIPECVVLIMTAHASPEVSVAALRSGARQVIRKPVNFEALELILQRGLEDQKRALEVQRLRNLERAHVERILARNPVPSSGREIRASWRSAGPECAFEARGAVRIPGSRMSEIEKVAILGTLTAVSGNTRLAADILGISVRKIQRRLRQWRGVGVPALES